MKRIIMIMIFSILSGCATLEEKMQSKYGMPLKVISYDGDTYKVATSEKLKGIVIKENDGLMEKGFSPKYGAIGVLIDATEILGRDNKFRIIADDYLSKTQPECKTIAGKIEKCNMECYEFEYTCNNFASKNVINPNYTNNDLKNTINPEIKSVVSNQSQAKDTVFSDIPLSSKSYGIEIKGIHLGMTKSEVTEQIGFDEFTVGGIRSKYIYGSPLHLDFYEEELDEFIFFFHPSGFYQVLDAVKGKYPSLKCEDSKVQNAMGATFSQIKCEYSDSSAMLSLSRVVDIVHHH